MYVAIFEKSEKIESCAAKVVALAAAFPMSIFGYSTSNKVLEMILLFFLLVFVGFFVGFFLDFFLVFVGYFLVYLLAWRHLTINDQPVIVMAGRKSKKEKNK